MPVVSFGIYYIVFSCVRIVWWFFGNGFSIVSNDTKLWFMIETFEWYSMHTLHLLYTNIN